MATRKKATKKTTRKAAKKTADRRITRKTAATTTPTAAAKRVAKAAADASVKRARQFAYLVTTPEKNEKGEVTGSKSDFNGPFSSEAAALDDASLMSETDSTVTLYRSVKVGTVQKSSRFVVTK